MKSSATEIIETDGCVTGVVSRDGVEEGIEASRGAFLTAGGFSHNDALRQAHHPTGTKRTTASPTDTAEELSMGIALCAATAMKDEDWSTPAIGRRAGSLARRAEPVTGC